MNAQSPLAGRRSDDPWAASSRVIAIFAEDPGHSLRAIRHVHTGAAGTPVWLYSTAPPAPEVASLCSRVVVGRNGLQVLAIAQRELWPFRAALSVGVWAGRGSRLLRLSPFLVPPFRSLFLNRHGDFLPGRPGPVAAHCSHRFREAAHNALVRTREIASDGWRLLSYHIWRSGPVTRAKDSAAAVSLLLLATLLRWCRYPHRRIFSRLHGRAALHLPPHTVAGGCGTATFFQRDRNWHPAAIAELAESSPARWLVWHTRNEAGALDDLLPLFDDPAAFAVSRQSDYRAWKPLLAPTAPFRTLQPGECTRVLAPLADTIVVDRRKLALLGVPQVSHPNTAWMLLFWKAAAAGWKSYSVGQEQPLAPQPDFPTEEAGFLAKVLLEPSLRALGPRQPLLARGNVAFSLQHTSRGGAAGARPRVLVVSPFLPYPLSHGGAVRIYNLCRALAPRVDFALIAVREHLEFVDYPKLHEVFREVRVVDLDQTTATDPGVPEQVRQHECPALRAAIADLCGWWKPDLVQFEYTQTAALKDAAQSIPSILVEHDITYTLYRQLAESEPSRETEREYQRWLAFENRWLGRYEAVWTMSDADRALAIESAGCDPGRTFSIPNGVDTERFRPCDAPGAQPQVLYVGSFRHLPNILAFERLRSEIMPLVWKRFPGALLRVVAGPRHEYFWRRFARRPQAPEIDPRILIHDFVEDLRPIYAEATVVAVPLEVSAGTNLKVMEAMACGKPVVSTPAGCAGLDLANSRDLVVRASAADFADALCRLLENDGLRRAIAARARHTVEARFSWTAIAESAWQSYQLLMRPVVSASGQQLDFVHSASSEE